VAHKSGKEAFNVACAIRTVHVTFDGQLAAMVDLQICAIEYTAELGKLFESHLLQKEGFLVPGPGCGLCMARMPVAYGKDTIIRKMLAGLKIHRIAAGAFKSLDREMP
jgi:hypothetical protein